MLDLSDVRRIIRLLPDPLEKRVRRAGWSLVPVRHQSEFTHVFHCCVWKTASQWVRLILSDPRVYRGSGLRARHMSVRKWAAINGQDGGVHVEPAIYTPLYQSYDVMRLHLDSLHSSAFFIYRDPRDLLVSRYFSRLSAHPATPEISVRRQVLQDMSKEDGLIEVMADFDVITDIVDSWLNNAGDDNRVVLFRYEDLTGVDRLQYWRRLLQHSGVGISDATLSRVLEFYSFKSLAGGREKGKENSAHKYRKGEPGDWMNHFTPAVSEAFYDKFGDIEKRWGYGNSSVI